MAVVFLCFSLGIIVAGYMPSLPPISFLLVIFLAIFFAVFLVKEFPIVKLPISLLAGIAYGIYSGHQFLNDQLVDDLVARDIFVEGKIIDLPEEDSRRQTFTLLVSNAYDQTYNSDTQTPTSFERFPKKIHLSSFGDLRVKPGECWRLLVKLKKPRGFVNPGGFDYQVSLLRRGIGAQGYLRSSLNNKKLKQQPGFSMDVLRYQLQQWLVHRNDITEKGIMTALLVGDTSLVDKPHWNIMQKTGTNHLIAISGLHLGFFAIVGFFLGNLLGRFLQLVWHSCPSMMVGYCFSISFAVFYSIVAGFNIPTIRTLIMLIVVQWVCVWRRSFHGTDSLLFALVLVLLYDPLASFDIGFWLSFIAVGMLIFCFSGRIALSREKSSIWGGHFYEFVKSQWVMFIGLLVPLAILVHSSALLAPPANFVAIPLVTFFVVPCLILAAVCHFSWVSGEDFFLTAADLGLSWLNKWLTMLLTAGDDNLNPLVNFNPWAIALALVSVLLILLPKGVCYKGIGFCGLLFALVIPLKPKSELQMLIFDVGQGTAILLRTPHHQLLYDTGPAYTDNFDAGSALIVPYLQSQSMKHLDTLVVSHNDRDHSGGLTGVLTSTFVDSLLLGEPEKYRPDKSIPIKSHQQEKSCHEQLPWQWDQVTFRFLTWPILPSAKANNHSCVLLVEYQQHKILLTGDIEKEVERQLLIQNSIESVDVLFAPHHGSHTSSTQAFVAQTKPHFVIYSAGYHNQHGHPHKDVQARYKLAGAEPLNTALTGAIEFNWNRGELDSMSLYRESSRRYWFDNKLK
jgi:competence protein ComEC